MESLTRIKTKDRRIEPGKDWFNSSVMHDILYWFNVNLSFISSRKQSVSYSWSVLETCFFLVIQVSCWNKLIWKAMELSSFKILKTRGYDPENFTKLWSLFQLRFWLCFKQTWTGWLPEVLSNQNNFKFLWVW